MDGKLIFFVLFLTFAYGHKETTTYRPAKSTKHYQNIHIQSPTTARTFPNIRAGGTTKPTVKPSTRATTVKPTVKHTVQPYYGKVTAKPLEKILLTTPRPLLKYTKPAVPTTVKPTVKHTVQPYYGKVTAKPLEKIILTTPRPLLKDTTIKNVSFIEPGFTFCPEGQDKTHTGECREIFLRKRRNVKNMQAVQVTESPKKPTKPSMMSKQTLFMVNANRCPGGLKMDSAGKCRCSFE